jgi:hypothetical protein
LIERGDPEHTHRPANGVTHSIGVARACALAAEVYEQIRPDVSKPCEAAPNGAEYGATQVHRDVLHGVNCAEHVLSWRTLLGVEGRPKYALVIAEQAVRASSETDPVLLETMPQPRLRYPPSCLDLMSEQDKVRPEIWVYFRCESRCDSAKKDAAKSGSRITRKRAEPERQPSGRRDRARVKHLELGQHHVEHHATFPPVAPSVDHQVANELR